MKFTEYNKDIKDKVLITNIPNSFYWGNSHNGLLRIMSRYDKGAKNISLIYVYNEQLLKYEEYGYFEDGLVLSATLTGRYAVSNSKTFYEVVFPFYLHWRNIVYERGYIEISHNPNDVQAWHIGTPGQLGITTPKVTNNLNKILERNKIIQSNNVLCARIVNLCKAKGIALPNNTVNNIRRLQDYIVSFSYYLESVADNDNSKISRYNLHNLGELYSLLGNDYRIGSPVAIAPMYAIIIGFIFLASLGTTVWLLCLKYNPSSKVNLEYSNKLTAELIKYLPKDVYDKLISENKEFERIANRVIQDTAGLGTVKTIALVVGGFVVTKFIIDNYNVSRKNTNKPLLLEA